MTKPESYSITPRQVNANKQVYNASYVVLESFGMMVSKGEFKAATERLIKSGEKPLKDLLASQKTLLERCEKLSGENEALKMIHQSTEQERKDQKQNQEYIKRLLDKIDKLEQKT